MGMRVGVKRREGGGGGGGGASISMIRRECVL